MPRQWMLICAQLAVLTSALVDYVFAAENKYGTISVVGPAFVNREVTLKATPFYPWECEVEWRYIMEGGTQLQTMHGPKVTTYSEDGSFFLKWRPSIEYNISDFYAGCSTNKTIRTRMVPIHLKEEGNLPKLIVPEFLDGEGSTTICEVRNVFPAPEIEIHVDKELLADAQQTDSFNRSSLTFTSLAKVTKANKTWNGKKMCCTRKIKYDIGLYDKTVCKHINMKYPPSDLSMSVHKIHEYTNSVHVCLLDMSCETNESNPPCTIEWASVTDNLQYVRRSNWTNGDSGRFRSVSNVSFSVSKDMPGTITCATRCDHFKSHLNTTYTVTFQGDPTLNLNTTSPVHLYPTLTVTVRCLVDDNDAKGQWTLWWEDENSTEMKTCNKTDECLLTLHYARDGENIYTCNAWKSNVLLKYSLTVISATADGRQSHETDIHTFRFPVINVLIGAGVIGGLCILFVIGRCMLLKRQKIDVINTVEIVENHSDTSSDNEVLHIATEGVQYAVVQRQAATQRIETQNPQDDECLKYAELDIKFLQAANALVPSRKKNTPTEYADIEFFSTQGPVVEHPGYHYASV
ncbi:uncharacterized protein LOC128202649 isoform X1 [Mya arenaria]|uniref:uncharacterized protein LOC128202649 isoform X1 n=1 Tax=Mya arenaria TaxID=6604 RepID=UPI0022E5FA0B|nr:uncharacterized protein LOC128202649 isoform X1 [Mya arenaria]